MRTSQRVALFLAGLAAGTAYAQPSGLYLGLGGGLNFLDDSEFDITAPAAVTVENDYDSGTVFLGSVGYDFGPVLPLGKLRGEVELSSRDNDIDDHSVDELGGDLDGSTGEASTTALMANLLVDIDTGTALTPYLGAGVGYAWSDLEDFGVDLVPDVLDDDDSAFAWQLIAGAGYGLTERLTLGLDYRFFSTTADIASSAATGSARDEVDLDSDTVTLGLRYRF